MMEKLTFSTGKKYLESNNSGAFGKGSTKRERLTWVLMAEVKFTKTGRERPFLGRCGSVPFTPLPVTPKLTLYSLAVYHL